MWSYLYILGYSDTKKAIDNHVKNTDEMYTPHAIDLLREEINKINIEIKKNVSASFSKWKRYKCLSDNCEEYYGRFKKIIFEILQKYTNSYTPNDKSSNFDINYYNKLIQELYLALLDYSNPPQNIYHLHPY